MLLRIKIDVLPVFFIERERGGKHTGVYDAIVKAVKAVDGCVAKVVEAAKENGYEVVMIAEVLMKEWELFLFAAYEM